MKRIQEGQWTDGAHKMDGRLCAFCEFFSRLFKVHDVFCFSIAVPLLLSPGHLHQVKQMKTHCMCSVCLVNVRIVTSHSLIWSRDGKALLSLMFSWILWRTAALCAISLLGDSVPNGCFRHQIRLFCSQFVENSEWIFLKHLTNTSWRKASPLIQKQDMVPSQSNQHLLLFVICLGVFQQAVGLGFRKLSAESETLT